MPDHKRPRHTRLMCGAAFVALALATGSAQAQTAGAISIAPQSLDTALNELGAQSNQQVLIRSDVATGKVTRGVVGAPSFEVALSALLEGTGLTYRKTGDTFLVVRADDPQSGGAAGDGADGTVEALIVTAQKREEDIQDVPIAISAFTQEALERSQIAGGPDLMTQVPNMTFTKTNFSSYSIQIRGIGTQAISATTDPAVAVAFNNTPFIRNRFFEQEFYDLQRVEVLRGPQGTLYGRNATAGVVNIISAKPKFNYEAKLSADVANYSSTRLEGMVNIPLVEDTVALRLAGAWTKREGFVTNEITGNPIDGRDLWSTRASLRWSPNDRIDANLIWEHFEEDDDRLRSGKQLCSTHEVTEVAGFPTTHFQALPDSGQGSSIFAGVQATFSQGCTPASLYAPESFQTPNGLSLPYYIPLGAVFLPVALDDPYLSRAQSTDLRVIESTVDPQYRAKSDLVEFQLSVDVTDALTLTSETAWASDFIFSTQDFNRFSTARGAWLQDLPSGLGYREDVLEDGVFCDPQVGCADRLVAVDLSTAKSKHFSQEFRLGSNFDGPFNFSLGGNFLRYDTEDKYYVFINSLSLIAAISPYPAFRDAYPPYEMGVTDNRHCLPNGPVEPDYNEFQQVLFCTYIDPNPIGSLNDLGHNYFLSKNPYKLISYAVFGEAYYNVADNLKITGGLRWTVDKKEAPRIPSWVLASETVGYPVIEVTEQEWREPTGRLTVDWKPDLEFTDETLLYASYARGYKAGGSNPPPYGIAIYGSAAGADALREESVANPKTFEAEFVDAFELGAKNTLLDGRLTLNTAAFYYDYKGYQISQIIDRSATNYNFDAEVWGLEIEADWRPLENLKLGFKGGYENTRVADGMQAIDIMDRTAGDPNWVVVRPFPSIPSNCILPAWLFVGNTVAPGNPELVNLGGKSGGNPGGCEWAYVFGKDPVTGGDYVPFPTANVGFGTGFGFIHQNPINYPAWSTDPADYPGVNWPGGVVGTTYPGWNPETAPNNGEGIFKQLGGNELPNAPHFTATITADYTVPLPNDWLATLHTDLYYQSEAWTRIFNTEGYDKLKAYTNVNLAAIFTNEDAGWKVMAYVKNVFDRDSITGAFLNSDDTGLTTNVFLTEPRLFGLRVTKEWTGGPLLGTFGARRAGPYPFELELGGQVQRHDAPAEDIRPSFADLFTTSDVDSFAEAQDDDLDWGDGREVKLSWRPNASPWKVSAGFRYGETNTSAGRFVETSQTPVSCAFGGYLAFLCQGAPAFYFIQKTNFSETSAREREEHTLIDFAVGRDFGLGGLSRSEIAAGIRYARLESSTNMHIDGVPDWNFPQGWYYPGPPNSHTHFVGEFENTREFEGTGPVLAWDASQHLLGSDDSGHLGLDWSVGGGVLFGKQTTTLAGDADASRYVNRISEDGLLVIAYGSWVEPDFVTATDELNTTRSSSVTVPTAAVSVGLSYNVDRFKIGAGYRWERYFDALDGGHEEAEDVDRTIDGPYFKIAVGFGG